MRKDNFIKKFINKYKLLPVQVKASLWFAICSILQKGIAFITMPFFTRLMTTEQYGYYTTYTSWYSLILVFTSLNLYYGVFNNAMIKYENNKKRFISSMQGLVFVLTGIVFGLYLLFSDIVNQWMGINTTIGCFMFLQLMCAPAYEFWLAENRFDYKYSVIVRTTLLKSIINPLLGLVLVLLSTEKAYARIISLVAVEILFSGTIAFKQFKKGRCFFDKEYWSYALKFNIPLLPHYLSGQILNQSDRIMIGYLSGNTDVAIYSVAYSIGLLTNIFTNAINGAITPWFYKRIRSKEYDNMGRVVVFSVLLVAVIVVGIIIFGPEIISILAPEEYKSALKVIPPVAVSVVFMYSYNLFANIEFYFEKKKFVLIGSVVSAILNVILNFIFIPKYGFVAAAYTTLACYILYCVLHALVALYICKQEKIPLKIYKYPIVFGIWGASFLIGIFSNMLYNVGMVRYLIIFVLVILVFVFRKKILQMLKIIRS